MPVDEPTPELEALRRYLAGHEVTCPRCEYNLQNLKVATCPECGLELSVRRLKVSPLPVPRSLRVGLIILGAMSLGGTLIAIASRQVSPCCSCVPVGAIGCIAWLAIWRGASAAVEQKGRGHGKLGVLTVMLWLMVAAGALVLAEGLMELFHR